MISPDWYRWHKERTSGLPFPVKGGAWYMARNFQLFWIDYAEEYKGDPYRFSGIGESGNTVWFDRYGFPYSFGTHIESEWDLVKEL